MISIIASEWLGLYSIDFLNSVKESEKITDLHVEGNITNYDSLYRFNKFKEMSIYPNYYEKIDLAKFLELIEFSSDNLSSFNNLDIHPITYGLFSGKVDFGKSNIFTELGIELTLFMLIFLRHTILQMQYTGDYNKLRIWYVSTNLMQLIAK